MGWQDIIGSVLTAGATGNPMAFGQNKLEQAFKQFQMQKMTEQLEMQREMHELEKRKADFNIKHLQTIMDQENKPVDEVLSPNAGYDLSSIFQPGTTLGQAKGIAPIAEMFRKQGDEYAPIPGTTALFGKKTGTVKETGLEGKPEKPVNVPAWMDALGVATMGSEYHTPVGQKKFADYLKTPEGNQRAEIYQKEYTKRNSPPVIIQTDKGFMKVDKGGGVTPVTGEGGKPIYRVTPSEIKTSHIALNDNIKSVEGAWEAYNKGLVGPVTGRAKQLGAKFFNDKEITTLKRRVAQLRTVIYGLSGKQINESEQTWLKEEILPELIQPSENFEVALKEFDAWVKRRKGLMEQEYPALSDGQPTSTKDASVTVTSDKDLTPVIQYLTNNKGKMTQKAMYDELVKKWAKDDIYKAWAVVKANENSKR